MQKIKRILKKISIKERISKEEMIHLRKLYDEVHDLDKAKDVSYKNTAFHFAQQWENHPTGNFLLSDPNFKENVDTILSEEEILIKKEWFRNKKILDAGCGALVRRFPWKHSASTRGRTGV